MADPALRFTGRAEDYHKYRPRYPSQIAEALESECRLTSESTIADIGAGTGLLTELFLSRGNRVIAVEPNREMREVCKRLLNHYPLLQVVDGRAEATTVTDQSVDAITVGQAFHWFELERTRTEFLRILRPQSWVALIWNLRDSDASPFLRAYQKLLHDYAVDLPMDRRLPTTESLNGFFGSEGYRSMAFRHKEDLPCAAVVGRAVSSSCVPNRAHRQHRRFVAELRDLFLAHQEAGRVTYWQTAILYYGQLQGCR